MATRASEVARLNTLPHVRQFIDATQTDKPILLKLNMRLDPHQSGLPKSFGKSSAYAPVVIHRTHEYVDIRRALLHCEDPGAIAERIIVSHAFNVIPHHEFNLGTRARLANFYRTRTDSLEESPKEATPERITALLNEMRADAAPFENVDSEPHFITHIPTDNERKYPPRKFLEGGRINPDFLIVKGYVGEIRHNQYVTTIISGEMHMPLALAPGMRDMARKSDGVHAICVLDIDPEKTRLLQEEFTAATENKRYKHLRPVIHWHALGEKQLAQASLEENLAIPAPQTRSAVPAYDDDQARIVFT
jgi:hypothetical protein